MDHVPVLDCVWAVIVHTMHALNQQMGDQSYVAVIHVYIKGCYQFTWKCVMCPMNSVSGFPP